MTYQPPIPYSTPMPPSADEGHLRALAICHYVWGGLTILFSSVFIIYIVIGVLFTSGAIPLNVPAPTIPTTTTAPTTNAVALYQSGTTFVRAGNTTVFQASNQPSPPTWIGDLFIVIGSAVVLIGWTIGVLTIISGRCIAKHRRRTFSLVMAGINCASFPFGTVLGVFTFVVLLRASVKATYYATV